MKWYLLLLFTIIFLRNTKWYLVDTMVMNLNHMVFLNKEYIITDYA